MKKYLLALVIALMPMTASAAGAGVHLDQISVDMTNQASLQRGMKTFVNYCMGCHSAKYQRFERAAMDLGMPNELVEENLILGTQKVGEQMTISMTTDDAANWFGNPPPDLSLEARLRGPDWIYTYMRSFYMDDSRPWGVNNVVFKDVGMPNVLGVLQGDQTYNCEPGVPHSPIIDPLTGETINECLAQVRGTGSMSPQEFDQLVYDLTNFLAYMGEPYLLDSHRMGTYVLIFLFLFFFVAYALKKEYWKDIH